MITILGPTASGKTSLAVELAVCLDAEIISGDSRQVYRGMDLGTGKDLNEYTVSKDGMASVSIPYHLIDIVPAGSKYTVYDFQRDFLCAYQDITSRSKRVVFCGGSGLYVESVLRSYRLFDVPANPPLRHSLEGKSLAELTEILSSFKTLHNTTDVDSPQRAIRAIEIETFYQHIPAEQRSFPTLPNITFGIDIPRELRRQRITERLHRRLDEGMLQEVQSLLDSSINPEDLIYYGLEYKYLTRHLIGEITYDEMVHDLEIAIHQFAKRQMTWFRGMERRGITIHWIDGTLPIEEKVEQIREYCRV
ncbi:MAG: tRNA (adenosine(37)-N6)-dimethylallyltransferase MiaA [Bacteroidaceae bacterium]|nr:tRNA (adenosine(37)-N6)-dimethylallyltransferase MiaA [Bacteroidaceae bacterium]